MDCPGRAKLEKMINLKSGLILKVESNHDTDFVIPHESRAQQ